MKKKARPAEDEEAAEEAAEEKEEEEGEEEEEKPKPKPKPKAKRVKKKALQAIPLGNIEDKKTEEKMTEEKVDEEKVDEEEVDEEKVDEEKVDEEKVDAKSSAPQAWDGSRYEPRCSVDSIWRLPDEISCAGTFQCTTNRSNNKHTLQVCLIVCC